MAMNRLHEQLEYMIVLEDRIEHFLTEQLSNVKEDRGIADLLVSFLDTANTQKRKLMDRLEAIGEGDIQLNALTKETYSPVKTTPSAILQKAYTALNEAIIGYTTLSIIAKRSRDSAIIGEGNTTDIADQHTRNYITTVRSISSILNDVVIAELEHEDHCCECTCACCGIGLCICATYNRETLSNAWADAGPFADKGDLLVLRPRPGSPAAKAGLQAGDFIVAADGRELASYATLYEIADGYQSGESIGLRVRRANGELEDLTVEIP
jgi:membrane-associated protease RseP (regulator of RpoE activity)